MIELKTKPRKVHTSKININSDWSRLYTAERAEENLVGFKFKGPGWYFIGKDTMLVIPFDTLPSGKGLYRFEVFTNRNPLDAFQWVVDAPVQVDERFDHV